MAEKYKFFDPVQREDGTYDREYSAQEFTDYFKTLINTGILKAAGNQLNVTANGSNMMTTIDTGVAFILGRYYENDSLKELLHDTESLGNSRIDRIVIRMDLSTEARYVKAFIKKGVASANPVAPPLTQTANFYEISLAQVLVVGGQTFISAEAVVDERGTNDICPWADSNILPSFDDNALKQHIADNSKHLQDGERGKWDKKADFIAADKSVGVDYPDPNTSLDSILITNHANAQSEGSNNFWYIDQIFYNTVGPNSSRSQFARSYLGVKADMKIRHFYNGQWSPWGPSLQGLKQSVSNGKALVASAITDMGVATSPTAEFATIAKNVRAIQTFKFREQYFLYEVGTAARHQVEFLFDAGFSIKHANIICHDFFYDNNSKRTGSSILLTAGESSFRQVGGATSGSTILANVSKFFHTNSALESIIDGRYVRVRLTYYSSTSISAQTLAVTVQAWG